jgi:hypothetical protein
VLRCLVVVLWLQLLLLARYFKLSVVTKSAALPTTLFGYEAVLDNLVYVVFLNHWLLPIVHLKHSQLPHIWIRLTGLNCCLLSSNQY